VTPAIIILEDATVPFELLSYSVGMRRGSIGEDAARALGLDPRAVFKTLLAKGSDESLVMTLIPVRDTLDMRALAMHIGVKRVQMATPSEAERATGYRLGGISPLGTRRSLPTVVDQVAYEFDKIYVSAGKRGLELGISPSNLIALTSGMTAVIRAAVS
jgi:Cys-tRNA(Pro)/Cys-tRNA(Cys) deacylase